jgi:hypothetical protein
VGKLSAVARTHQFEGCNVAKIGVWILVLAGSALGLMMYLGRQAQVERLEVLNAEIRHQQELAAAEERHSQQWRYSEKADAMTGQPIKRAFVKSRNQVEFASPYQGPQRAQLELRVHPRFGRDVMLTIERGQLMCSGSGCTVMVKFGDAKPTRFNALPAKDGASTVIFIEGFDRFVASLRKSTTINVEAVVYREGSRAFEFATDGLDFS